MPTIIAKKVVATLKSAEENSARAAALANYITRKEDQDGLAKCTAIKTIGFSSGDLPNEDRIAELREDMEMPGSKHRN